jgi:hypothetical protein
MAAMVVNVAGDIVFINARTEQYFGYERQGSSASRSNSWCRSVSGRITPGCAGPTSRTPRPA